MGKINSGGDQTMQREEQKESRADEHLSEARYYLRSFGLSCIFESTSNVDLKYVWGKKSDMPAVLYPMVVKLAEEEAARFQKELCDKLSDPNDPIDDEHEIETPEEVSDRLEMVARWREMTPRDFWMKING